MAAPERLEKRQDINQLLQLASLAGIALPTDPAVLLRLGPLASRLAAALPTSSVLAVLETAAPQSFISRVVHDASYAQSFESAFAAGSSPSWFTALPTDVKSYLHTYSGLGGLATVAGAVESAEGSVSSGITAAPSTPNPTAASTSSASGTPASNGSTSTTTTTATSTTGSSASSGTAAGENSASSTPAATPGGAVQLSGTFAASFAGMETGIPILKQIDSTSLGSGGNKFLRNVWQFAAKYTDGPSGNPM
ncbi:hypothetical protein MMC29_007112 [Sticta canariensis]|nr:hypothetical protein [Sticta canariensis]